MSVSLKPVYLLADSQLLFRQGNESEFPSVIKQLFKKRNIKAAYIGASNNDDPAFYEIFEAAMQTLDISDCAHIQAQFPARDRKILEQSDLILLAGGDPRIGWDIMQKQGITEILLRKYYDGSLLIGISAGAVQLGMFACVGQQCFNVLQIIPFNIAVHDEENDWKDLKHLLIQESSQLTGIGIPLGGGMVCFPDHSIEALNKPLFEIKVKDTQVNYNLILPH